MIPLVLVGLAVLVLVGLSGRQTATTTPAVPPPPPPPGSTVVYAPDPVLERMRVENDEALRRLREDEARAAAERARSEAQMARTRQLLREAEETEARNRAELEDIEREWRNR